MIDIAEETLGLRRRGLSPRLWLLIPTFSPPSAPADFTIYLHSSLKCSPTVNGDFVQEPLVTRTKLVLGYDWLLFVQDQRLGRSPGLDLNQ